MCIPPIFCHRNCSIESVPSLSCLYSVVLNSSFALNAVYIIFTLRQILPLNLKAFSDHGAHAAGPTSTTRSISSLTTLLDEQ